MSGLEAALSGLIGRLTRQGYRFAIVGGLAVSARTEPRFTRDADVCVVVAEDAEADALVRSLQSEGYGVMTLVEQETMDRIATVRLATQGAVEDGIVLDLLFASSGVEAEIVASADEMELFEGISAPIASVPSLIALKVLARDDVQRPQDRVDLVALLGVASEAEINDARELLRLIHDRGYGRGRALVADLESLMAELGR
jgi:predicted nucleotidyltransferase